jgi:hypothetical protein
MRRKIVGYHRDDRHDWVAELDCGHQQHVRHNPPWMNRPWVEASEGRDAMLGFELDCKLCDVSSNSEGVKE